MDDSSVNLFGGTITTLSRSLSLRSRNHEMILNNVANADTPHYKPFALHVEEALQENTQPSPAARMERTDENHLAGKEYSTGDTPDNARSEHDDPLLFRGDQSGVDIDEEMTALAKNSLLYKASAQLIASKFKGLKTAITGGSK